MDPMDVFREFFGRAHHTRNRSGTVFPDSPFDLFGEPLFNMTTLSLSSDCDTFEDFQQTSTSTRIVNGHKTTIRTTVDHDGVTNTSVYENDELVSRTVDGVP